MASTACVLILITTRSVLWVNNEYYSENSTFIFKISITIIEATQLSGLDIDPVIRVQVGEQYRYTTIKKSSNNPFYNEVGMALHAKWSCGPPVLYRLFVSENKHIYGFRGFILSSNDNLLNQRFQGVNPDRQWNSNVQLTFSLRLFHWLETSLVNVLKFRFE